MHETLSDKIKEKIKETGIKQAHLAKKLGLTPQHLSKILERNQEKYMPKMAEILGIDTTPSEKTPTKSISIVSDNELVSLADNRIYFENLYKTALPSWPTVPHQDYYLFGYEIKEDVNFHLLTNDIVIFSSCIPLNLNEKTGIAFIKEESLIFIGKLKYNKGKIIIYNSNNCFAFALGDLLFGVAIYLERKIEE